MYAVTPVTHAAHYTAEPALFMFRLLNLQHLGIGVEVHVVCQGSHDALNHHHQLGEGWSCVGILQPTLLHCRVAKCVQRHKSSKSPHLYTNLMPTLHFITACKVVWLLQSVPTLQLREESERVYCRIGHPTCTEHLPTLTTVCMCIPMQHRSVLADTI